MRFIPWNNAAAFNPLSLSPALWLDASDSSTLYDATSGGSLVAPDGTIARWEDKSGNSRHATQSTPAARPLRKTAIQNGQAVVRYDGLNNSLIRTNDNISSNVGGITSFVVRKINGAHTTVGAMIASRHGSAGVRYQSDVTTASKMRVSGRRLAADSFAFAISAVNHGAGFNVQTGMLDYQNTTAKVWQNGTEVASNTSFQTAGVTETTNGELSIGGHPLASQFYNGDIAEVLIYRTALSDVNRQAVESYLNSKWAI